MTGANLAEPTGSAADAPPSRGALFLAFFKIGLCGFGGVAAWVRQVIVEERGWLGDRDFAELQGAASVLPGANTINLAVMLGDRYRGATGALSALCGLLLAPLGILVALASLYDRFADLAPVRAALAGAAAATAGLVLGNAFKLMRSLRGDGLALVCAGATFALVGLLHVSLIATLAVLAPLNLAALVILRARRQ